MKYQDEINQLLKDLFHEEWMSEEDFKEFKSMYFQQSGITMQKLSDEMQVGVDNGHTIQEQIELCRKGFNELH